MNNKERGRKNKKKGSNFEYRIVYKAREKGLDTKRIDLSGAGKEKGDVIIEGRRYECKYRSNGLKTLYKLYEKARDDKYNILNVDGFSVINIDDFLGSVNGKCKCFNNVKGIKVIRDWMSKAKKDGCEGIIVKVKKNLCLVIMKGDKNGNSI